jgi:ribonuclease D
MTELTKEEIRELPLLRFHGEIHLVDTPHKVDRAVLELEKSGLLGFDTEKRPTFRKGEYNHTALLQLATNHTAYIFQLKKIPLQGPLVYLLENPDITKIGVAIHDDLKDLNVLHRFQPDGFIDLNTLANQKSIPIQGVRRLAAHFLGGRISKSQQTSNWEHPALNAAQQTYAATDAWVCIEIYRRMGGC